MRLILAGGGTAGHVNPLLATASALADHEIVCLGTAEGLEAELVPDAGHELVTIAKIPLPRRPSPDLVRLPGAMRTQVRRLRRLYAERSIDVVVGFGGYVSTPAYLAARGEKIPVVIHEQNARPGLANRLGARFADVVALTFDSTPLRARRGLTRTIGLPLRPPIAALARRRAQGGAGDARREQAARFGLDPDRPIVVVTGGSLGALTINDAMASAAAQLRPDVQVIHLCGRGKDAAVRADVGEREGYVIIDYLRDMEAALALADLVVCRSGAGTVAELCALGIPAIYVPLAIGNGEQRLNAADVVAAGGARIVPNSQCSAKRLLAEITTIFDDSERLATMSRAAASCGHLDAADQLAELVEGARR
ncbi:undecaprenyldiphospho-muramoylpentapeptide beta-N-acetylglucosaminyltransferase [Nanchangia anserum]|uniref:UDP-N-acetylglucosamine--N-acetylmuramyl-(pentapeptide) pyrophosphoryl-undecaprenol N-acetylglucosamine transferase n=2 Tax=Nanchangia anserum TaxID=2692125 RepID=A0A8I0GAN8_9ACTO|nr:undecaprenyldiphospho-muramoylpentapeptide beta-N-acetylglucosaminyltransferase [Nanchangia anserum]MBD3690239.1 undecaprenyldiphospho-muramoylpentapeptide beta-N-acetylglucosaminyltransferase [Nanchangia anserum]QOX82579.1 undecaprenyldiphospho-muramoylpentapeptide beta-N-acetylglucosaminyltransferase [Nanchangia anserum]